MATAARQRPGWFVRALMLLLGTFFVLMFCGGGLLVGLLPLLDQARQAWLVRNWQPVSATVIDAALDSHRGSKGGATYSVRARYAYTWQGRRLEGKRIGLDTWGGSDNIGDWHESWHDRLRDAREREAPVAAWVNPDDPTQSVLERRVRWGMVAFRLPFGLLFTGAGLGAGWALWRASRGQLGSTHGKAAAATVRRRQGDVGEASQQEWSRSHRIAAPARQVLPPALPAGVRGSLADGDRLRFVSWWSRVLGALLVLVVPIVLAALLSGGSLGPQAAVLGAVVVVAMLVLGVHLMTDRWFWHLQGDAVLVERRSWLRGRSLRVTRADLGRLEHQLVYTSRTGNGPTVHHRRLQLRRADGSPDKLSPALAGASAVEALAAHLHHALAVR